MPELLVDTSQIPLRGGTLPSTITPYTPLSTHTIEEDVDYYRTHVAGTNAVSEATYLRALMDAHELTQQQVASAINKSNGYVSYKLSLLALPTSIQNGMSRGDIPSMFGRELAKLQNRGLGEEAIHHLSERITTSNWSLAEFKSYVDTRYGTLLTTPRRRGSQGTASAHTRTRSARTSLRSRQEVQEKLRLVIADLENEEDPVDGELLASGLSVKHTLRWVLRESEDFPFLLEDDDE